MRGPVPTGAGLTYVADDTPPQLLTGQSPWGSPTSMTGMSRPTNHACGWRAGPGTHRSTRRWVRFGDNASRWRHCLHLFHPAGTAYWLYDTQIAAQSGNGLVGQAHCPQ